MGLFTLSDTSVEVVVANVFVLCQRILEAERKFARQFL